MTLRESILLVDHSRTTLVFEESILRRRDAVIMTAVAGSEGLSKARDAQPGLIIFGYDLFDMAAPEFCTAIRSDEKTAEIALLLICDREANHERDACLSAGANDVVFRPLQRAELDQKVETLTRIPVRRSLRTIAKIEVSLERGGRFILGRTSNISAGGMLLELERTLPQDTRGVVHFYLPGDPVPLNLDVEIRRGDIAGSAARYGLEFIDMSDLDRMRVEQYVYRLRSRDTI